MSAVSILSNLQHPAVIVLYTPNFFPDRIQAISCQNAKKNNTFALPKKFRGKTRQVSGCGEMADALDLGSNAARHGGSSPSTRTEIEIKQEYPVGGRKFIPGLVREAPHPLLSFRCLPGTNSTSELLLY